MFSVRVRGRVRVRGVRVRGRAVVSQCVREHVSEASRGLYVE